MIEDKRFIIFIVAYQVEKILTGILEKIPLRLINSPNIEILIIDDGSSDQGINKANQWADDNDANNITILRNPVKQGYGGNQKLGYRIAVEAGFDYVILLQGNGCYNPELLIDFIRLMNEANTDVVIGSRTADFRFAMPERIGMPELIGDRILTSIQNLISGQRLMDYHSGYRGYSVAFLKQVSFEINSNDPHFDTEMLMQAFHMGAKIHEFDISAHYAGKISRARDIRYLKNVLFSTLRYRMHRLGMLCDLKYRRLNHARYEEKTFMAYSSHTIALRLIKEYRPKTLMDIGCGPGFIAKKCRQMGIIVTGLDITEPLPETVDHFRSIDLERDGAPSDALRYEMVLLLDVIEHLADPENFLLDLRNRNTDDTVCMRHSRIIISTPNIAFWAIRFNLLFGRFSYAERGILDITHKRLLTRKALRNMLNECGYTIEMMTSAGVPFEAVVGGRIGKCLGWISGIMANLWPGMFAFQHIVVCRPKPGVRQLIKASEQHRIFSDTFKSLLNNK